MNRLLNWLLVISCCCLSLYCSETCDDGLDGYCEEQNDPSLQVSSQTLIQKLSAFPIKKLIRTIGEKNLKLDFLLFASLVILILNYVIGSLKNNKIYNVWKDLMTKCWPGLDKSNKAILKIRNDHHILCIKPSQNETEQATGYESVAIQLTLVKRFNLVSILIDFYSLKEAVDVVSINYKLITNFKGVFGIVLKNLANDYRRNRQDLNQLTKQTKPKSLDSKYVFLYESSEMIQLLENEQLKENLAECHDFLLGIFYSDQPTSYPQKLPVEETKILTIEYKVSNRVGCKEVECIKKLCNALIKLFTNSDILSVEGKKKMLKNRALVYQPVEKKMQEEKKKLLEEQKQNTNRDRKAEREKFKKREEKQKKKMGKKGVSKMTMRN